MEKTRITFKEFKNSMLQGGYILKGARTGKTLFQSWIHRDTSKYDDSEVVSVWADFKLVKSTFGDYVRPVMGIYLSGL